MSYQNISFLQIGKHAIEGRYQKWFRTDHAFQYESGNIENHYQGNIFNLPNGNARRWDYIILKLQDNDLLRIVFAEPHPIKEGNVQEVLEKLEWLKSMIKRHPDLQHFEGQRNEFYWIYSNSKISANSQSRRKCFKVNLEIVGIPLVI